LVGFVTGHDFSRADKSQPGIPALAAAILILLKTNVAGAKAHFLFAVSVARLKSCPVTKRQKQCANRVFPQPVKPLGEYHLANHIGYETASSIQGLKFVEEQPQILRLTTPELHPTNEDLFVGIPA
jgi:hypothetical protein